MTRRLVATLLTRDGRRVVGDVLSVTPESVTLRSAGAPCEAETIVVADLFRMVVTAETPRPRAVCPTCGATVLDAPAIGRLLDVAAHPLGVWIASDGGRRKTVEEAAAGVAGHHEHRCPPAGQAVLFGAPQ